MSQHIDSAAPPPSPGFNNARQLSRILAVLLAIGFWITLAFLVAILTVAAWPQGITYVQEIVQGIAPPLLNVPVWSRVGLVVLMLVVTGPILLVLHYARRVFVAFAKGEVFAASTSAVLQTTAVWLIIAGIAPPRPTLFVVGIATFVAAKVIAEARRVADDNAGFI